MPKTADRPEVLTLAGAQWTRDPDDAARMESWPDGHVRMRADDLRRLDEHQAAADERERAQRAAAERGARRGRPARRGPAGRPPQVHSGPAHRAKRQIDATPATP